jgi:hypothetical protein
MLEYLFKTYGWSKLHYAGKVELLLALDEATVQGLHSAKEIIENILARY